MMNRACLMIVVTCSHALRLQSPTALTDSDMPKKDGTIFYMYDDLSLIDGDNPIWQMYKGRADKDDPEEGRSDFTVVERDKWAQAFKSWSGKRILIAGDSLSREHASAMQKEWKMLNGSCLEGKQIEYKGGLLTTHLNCSLPGGVNFTVAHMLLAGFVDEHSELVDDDGWKKQLSHFLWMRPKVFMQKAKEFDAIFLNMGHCILVQAFKDWARNMTTMVLDAAVEEGVLERISLMEHPAQHFQTPTGDYDLDKFNNNAPCDCGIPGEHLVTQQVYRNNHEMAEVAKRFGVPVIDFFEKSSSLCKYHPKPDCTHYSSTPSVYGPLVVSH